MGRNSNSTIPFSGCGNGCGFMVGLFLILLVIYAVGDKLGCIASEDRLRTGVQVDIAKTEIQEAKGLVWVFLKVRNESDWDVSLKVTVAVAKSTDPTPVASNSLEIKNLTSGETVEERIAFEQSELEEFGIPDPTDDDICRIRSIVEWVSKAGAEPNQQ